MSDHTPLPWKVHQHWLFGARSMPLPIASGYHDYATAPGGQYYAEGCANAALIVRAVNSHEAMVDVLTDVWFHLSDTTDPTLRKIADNARAALAILSRNGDSAA